MGNTLEALIVGAVQDMVVQTCIESGLDPEISTPVLFTACEERKILLRFACGERLDEEFLAEIIGENIIYIESGCFEPFEADDARLVAAAEKAIFMLYIASRDALDRRKPPSISLN